MANSSWRAKKVREMDCRAKAGYKQRKKFNPERLSFVNASPQPKPVLNRDKIVWLACQIWQTKGQTNREQEYWQKARHLLATNQPAPGRPVRSSK